jgi:hypothetical protein
MRHLAAAMLAMCILCRAAFASGASEDESFSCSGVETISVNAGFLDVEISGDDGSVVSMSSDLPPNSPFGGRGCKLLHEVDGARLKVWLEKDWPLDWPAGGSLTLRCPRSAELKVETVSGRITVERMRGRNCVLRTVSGQISVQESRGTLSAASVSGKIVLEADQGKVNVRTVSGAIEGRKLDVEGDSAFSTISGNVDIRLDAPLDSLRFDLRSLSGRIVVGNIRAERGLKMGTDGVLVRGHSVSGALIFR